MKYIFIEKKRNFGMHGSCYCIESLVTMLQQTHWLLKTKFSKTAIIIDNP